MTWLEAPVTWSRNHELSSWQRIRAILAGLGVVLGIPIQAGDELYEVKSAREMSASYYTPEVLTRCLTKRTLAERLKDLLADEILELTVCEPAMGSGAFLNAASQG